MVDLPEYRLEGKTALVTGASRGLGRDIALALARAGANVALGLRDPASGSGLASEIAALGRKAVPIQMDVLDRGQRNTGVDRAIAELGRIDILVNNVGGSIVKAAEDFTEADFDHVFNLNLKSSFFIAQRAALHMKANGSGAIVNMASQAGFVALPGEGLYCMAKAALVNMTRCMAVEWGRFGINMNAVAPTFIVTDGTSEALADPAFRSDVIERIAGLHRIGRPAEVSGAVVFLASPAASLITGQTLVIDGGWTAR